MLIVIQYKETSARRIIVMRTILSTSAPWCRSMHRVQGESTESSLRGSRNSIDRFLASICANLAGKRSRKTRVIPFTRCTWGVLVENVYALASISLHDSERDALDFIFFTYDTLDTVVTCNFTPASSHRYFSKGLGERLL